jgi:hypothetical protein
VKSGADTPNRPCRVHASSDEQTFQHAFVLYTEFVLIEDRPRELLAASPVLDPQVCACMVENPWHNAKPSFNSGVSIAATKFRIIMMPLLPHLAVGSIDESWNPPAR